MSSDFRIWRVAAANLSSWLATVRALPNKAGGTSNSAAGNLLYRPDTYPQGLQYVTSDDGTTPNFLNLPGETQVATVLADPAKTTKPQLFNILARGEVQTSDLASGTLDAGSRTQLYDGAGQLRVVTNAQAGTVNNVDVFQLAGGKKAVRQYTEVHPSYFGLSASNTDTQNATAMSLLADFSLSKADGSISNLQRGGVSLKLPPGVYYYGDSSTIKGNVSIKGTHPRGAVLYHTGTGKALTFNSTITGPFTAGSYYTAAVSLEDLTIMSPSGQGLFFGSVIQPQIALTRVEMFKISSGYAIDTGDAVYFMLVDNCFLHNIDKGVHQSAYCDLFVLKDCKIGSSNGVMAYLQGPTARLIRNNFEACSDGVAAVQVAIGAVATGYIKIHENRFGQESNAANWLAPIAPFDIAVLTTTATKQVAGLSIRGNDHLCTIDNAITYDTDGTTVIGANHRKTAPVLLNVGLATSYIGGNSMLNYPSTDYITTGAATVVRDNMSMPDGLMVDRLSGVSVLMRGLTTESVASARRRTRVVPSTTASFSGGVFGCYNSAAVDNYPVVDWANYQLPQTLARLGGYVEDVVYTSGMPMWMDTPGSIVTMAINGAAYPVGTPVYIDTSGKPTFTPPSLSRRIGFSQTPVSPATVRLEFAANLCAAAIPTSGTYTAGMVVDAITPITSGSGINQYTVTGWTRLTTGSTHVLGTDWQENRTRPDSEFTDLQTRVATLEGSGAATNPYIYGELAQALTAGVWPVYASNEQSGQTNMPRIAAANGADTSRQAIGVVVAPAGGQVANDIVKVYLPGAELTTTIDATSQVLNAPLYASAGTGLLTFSNASVAGVPRVMARLVSGGGADTTATIRVTLEAPRWSAMPTTGQFYQNDFVEAASSTILGSAGGRYMLRGWDRLTTGSAHVLGTDWTPVYVLIDPPPVKLSGTTSGTVGTTTTVAHGLGATPSRVQITSKGAGTVYFTAVDATNVTVAGTAASLGFDLYVS
ncbi:hypothetical protein [Deinococcus ruber]|uniref:Uncharacterized protein n=1 Tax=Deinococcus ruber TaxID=1848197 RepID=A0A918CD30_9DEIO|nr:hypothetical protein [Deinococcus ruber]GGR16906.1 hypothetical protein GCM10008957_31930 [Deinococcus ruber]